MSINNYAKKIEKYIQKKSESTRDLESAKGLLAPKMGNRAQQPEANQDTVERIGEFVLAIRKKREEIKSRKAK